MGLISPGSRVRAPLWPFLLQNSTRFLNFLFIKLTQKKLKFGQNFPKFSFQVWVLDLQVPYTWHLESSGTCTSTSWPSIFKTDLMMSSKFRISIFWSSEISHCWRSNVPRSEAFKTQQCLTLEFGWDPVFVFTVVWSNDVHWTFLTNQIILFFPK